MVSIYFNNIITDAAHRILSLDRRSGFEKYLIVVQLVRQEQKNTASLLPYSLLPYGGVTAYENHQSASQTAFAVR